MKKKLFIFLFIGLLAITLVGCGKKASDKDNKNKKDDDNVVNQDNQSDDKVDIIDVNSNSRPFAVVVNNTPVAVGVQEGLNKAYIVYELPTEGSTSRLIALYKDPIDLKVGTIRSVRHNFADFAFESNAILVAYGWSHYAQDELQGGGIINNINGIVEGPFWRENPEDLASEHTAYTNISQLKDYAIKKGYSLEGDNTILLNYSTGDVDLSSKDDVINATHLVIPYGNIVTEFYYNNDEKMYTKVVNGAWITDYATGENITTKNIIIEKITYNVTDDGYYWNLHDVGTGDGYYITNGKAVPIKWSKANRTSKTVYTYLDGTEIEVSDGRTYIEVQVTNQSTTIE